MRIQRGVFRERDTVLELLPLVIELHHAALVNLQRRPDLDVLR